MKVLQSSIFRAAVAIIVGALLVKFREETVKWLTIGMGALFFLAGIISFIIYVVSMKSRAVDKADAAMQAGYNPMTPAFPVGSLGSIVLGVVLALKPETFIQWIVYILGALLLLCALGQFFTLARARRYGSVPVLFWIFPAVLLLVAIYSLLQPMDAVSLPLFIIGWALMIYGVMECVNGLKIYRLHKAWDKLNAHEEGEAVAFTVKDDATDNGNSAS